MLRACLCLVLSAVVLLNPLLTSYARHQSNEQHLQESQSQPVQEICVADKSRGFQISLQSQSGRYNVCTASGLFYYGYAKVKASGTSIQFLDVVPRFGVRLSVVVDTATKKGKAELRLPGTTLQSTNLEFLTESCECSVSQNQFLLIPNGTDSRFAQIITPEGTLFEIGGTKVNGISQVLEYVQFVKRDGSKGFININSRGYPEKAFLIDSITRSRGAIDFNWISDSSVVMTFQDQKTETPGIVVPVELNAVDLNSRNLSIINLNESPKANPVVSQKKLSLDLSLPNQSLSMVIDVQHCKLPATDEVKQVTLDVEYAGGNKIQGIPAKQTVGSTYFAEIPKYDPESLQNFDRKCAALVERLKQLTFAISIFSLPIIKKVFAQVALASFPWLAVLIGGAAILAVILEVYTPAEICNYFGDLYLQFLGNPTFTINVDTVDQQISKGPLQYVQSGITPKYTVDLPEKRDLVEFKAVSPTGGILDSQEGYTIESTFSCIGSSAVVSLAIQGSDGSFLELQSQLDSNQKGIFQVPGGRTSEKDTAVFEFGDQTWVYEIDLSFVGQIAVDDNGNLDDDSFGVTINQTFLGSTPVGSNMEFALRGLNPGDNLLIITGLVVPDNVGTYRVRCRKGVTFSDGTTTKSGVIPFGGAATFSVIVPGSKPLVTLH